MIPELACPEILQDTLAGFESQVSAYISAHCISEDYIEWENPGSIVPAAQSESRMRQMKIPEIF